MTQKDWLDVSIRVLGVYILFCAVTNFAESWLMYADYSRSLDFTFRYYLIYGWIYALLGLVFLKAPGILSNFAYPPESGEVDTGIDEGSDKGEAE